MVRIITALAGGILLQHRCTPGGCTSGHGIRVDPALSFQYYHGMLFLYGGIATALLIFRVMAA